MRAIAGVASAVLAFTGHGELPSGDRAWCPPLSPALAGALDSAWTAYRASDIAAAERRFRRVHEQCPNDPAAVTGLGYTLLRAGRLADARLAFDRALALLPSNYDAIVGRGMVAYRQGDAVTARLRFEEARRAMPADSTVASYLRLLPVVVDRTALPPRERPDTLVVGARTGQRIFEVPDRQGNWRPLWIKALNIGAALPGKHPSEFPPDDGTYEGWIALATRMGVNALRVYTIHPPHFYAALRRWNLARPDSPMWLIHGVWTELPPGAHEERYDDIRWADGFRGEMRDVVDVLHGHAAIQPRPGHAWGLYTADVSPWTLAYITGREWEPYSVVAYAARYRGKSSFRGRYLTVTGGNAVDVWLGEANDYLISYEMDRYHAQRPVAYTNWPTLDPLHHPTESTLAEEDSIRRARGEIVPQKPKEFDNDAIGLDAAKVRATAAYPAGPFASYHAYPYYPDFLVLDPGYAAAASPEGPSHYFGYLRALVEHHGDMPVVISEYGVPSSRGVAHLQPQGWHHGGHSEQAQAAINARLTRDIYAAGAAGAGLFAIIDEWFKKNWIVSDFELPAERNRLWLNALDAEQNYGVIAMRAGHRDSAIVIDGDGREWGDRGRWYDPGGSRPDSLAGPLRVESLRVTHDEAYVYLLLQVGAIDWARGRYLVGIDSYREDLGDRRLPYTRTRTPVGLEFVVDLRGPEGSHLLVDSRYNPYRSARIIGAVPAATQQLYRAPFQTVANDDGRYDTLRVVTNRRRIGRDGRVYPERGYDRNLLLHARQRENSLADWYADSLTSTIEVRLPWGMLHVLDPSSRHVLYTSGGSDPGGVKTPGFRFVVESYDPRSPARAGDRLPRRAASTRVHATPRARDVLPFGDVPLWSWPTWDVPRWHADEKPVVDSMRQTFRAIPDRPAVPPPARAPSH